MAQPEDREPLSAKPPHQTGPPAPTPPALSSRDHTVDDPLIQTTSLLAMLTRYREGDTAALDELLRRINGRLERLATRMLRSYPVVRDHEQTADVLQNALIRLTRALHEVRPSSTVDFFSFTAELIRRELLDLARYHRRRSGVNQPLPDAAGAPLDPVDPHPHEPQDLERWCALHEAIDRLPVDQRQVFTLTFYHDLARAEIARALGVSDRQVRRLWRASCLRLHELLGGDLPV